VVWVWWRSICDYRQAKSLNEEALLVYRRLGDRRGEAMSLNNLGVVAELQGDRQSARWCYEQARSLLTAVGDRASLCFALGNAARIAAQQGDRPHARTLLGEALAIERALRDRRGAATDLDCLAELDLQEAQYERAARLLGAAAAMRQQIAAPIYARLQKSVDRCIAQLQAALSPADLAVALAAGQAMAWEEAIAYALEEADG
jgi:tetratricopeptide (TPR) repeat protein